MAVYDITVVRTVTHYGSVTIEAQDENAALEHVKAVVADDEVTYEHTDVVVDFDPPVRLD